MRKYHLFKINLTVLNIISLLLMIIAFGFVWLLFPDMLKKIALLFNNDKFLITILPLMIFYFVLHELLHAIGYIVNGANYKKITFGIEIEKSVFYCLCKDEITKKNILYSLMYPLFLIGIFTGAISIIFRLPVLLLLSICNISGAAGDIMYFLFIIKLDKNIMYSEMDDGTSFAIVSKDNPSKYHHFGLTYIGDVNEISRKDFTRIKISKASWVLLIFCIILLIIAIFV